MAQLFVRHHCSLHVYVRAKIFLNTCLIVTVNLAVHHYQSHYQNPPKKKLKIQTRTVKTDAKILRQATSAVTLEQNVEIKKRDILNKLLRHDFVHRTHYTYNMYYSKTNKTSHI